MGKGDADMADIDNFVQLMGHRRYSREIYIFKKGSSGNGEVVDILKIAGI